MRSVNWFFSAPLCKKQIKRFWPLWGMYTFVLFMLMPVFLLLETRNQLVSQELFLILHRHGMSMAAEMAPWIALFFGALTAMALWSYLYNNRSVSMMHALPLKRDTLFLTNYITGILFFLIPNLFVFLLALGAEAIVGVVAIKSLAIWLLCQTLLCFFFYSFATLFAFVTGHILVLPCLYVIFNFLTIALQMLLDWSFGEFVYGYASGSIPFLNWFGKWLSPAYAYLRELRLNHEEVSSKAVHDLATIQGLPVVYGYAVAGLVMVILAYFLYRHRKLELSGEVVAVRFLQPIFKYGVAICSGLVFGNIFYQVLPGLFPKDIVSLLFFQLLWGAIGYFAAEMLLRKSFRVIRQSYKGCLVVMVLLTASMLAMEWDVSGYEKAVPSADQVGEVSFSDRYNVRIKDQEGISNVLALHEAIVKEKNQIELWSQGEDPEIQALIDQSRLSNGLYIEKFTWNHISLNYTLKNGATLKREYRIPISEELLEQKGSPAACYAAIANQTQYKLQSVFPDMLKAEELVQIQIQTTNELAEERGIKMASEASQDNHSVIFSGEDAQLLYQAVREDIQAGRLEKQWFLQNEEALRTNYINSIYFTFRGDYNTDNLYAGSWYENRKKDGENEVYYEVSFPVQSTASATLAVLQQLGLVERIHFTSEYDWQLEQYRDGENGYGKDSDYERKYPVRF